jgi:primase-polymerase (primpol)-like protein
VIELFPPPLKYQVRSVENGINLEIGMPLPRLVEFHFQNIPHEIRNLPQWVAFRFIPAWDWRPGRKAWTKLPVDALTGKAAKVDDPMTWCSYTHALSYYQQHHQDENPRSVAHGIGLVIDAADPYAAGDLDNHVENGIVGAFAWNVILKLGTYTELSVSGCGLRLLMIASVPKGSRMDRGRGVEFYSSKRFVTITGAVIPGHGALRERQAEFDRLYASLWPSAPPPTSAGQVGAAHALPAGFTAEA